MAMEGKAVGRLAMVSLHLMPPRRSGVQQIPAYSSSSSSSLQVNKRESKYEKVHGEVSSESVSWRLCTPSDDGPPFLDIIYEKANGEGIAKITINRPARRNAFRPQTLKEMTRALNDARDDIKIGVIILTGKPFFACPPEVSTEDPDEAESKLKSAVFEISDFLWGELLTVIQCLRSPQFAIHGSSSESSTGNDAFCSGGDQALRGPDGYADTDSFGRLNVLDVQIQIRRLPKPVIAMVAGYAVGGGHVLHMVCDLTIAANNAVFGQTGPKVGSFDAGYGCTAMARLVGPKRAREMWFLCRFYSAKEAMEMGLVNTVVPLENLEQETVKWCREILRNSPTAIRVCKAALNAVDDGHAGIHELGGNATLLYYGSEEANEGKAAYLQRRRPDFSKFPRLP